MPDIEDTPVVEKYAIKCTLEHACTCICTHLQDSPIQKDLTFGNPK